jgi:hypothetical protein
MCDRLLAAKTEPEARLCKVALGALADAEIQRAFTEENATGRRQEPRRAARAPEQGVPNVREENVREEAAVEVAAGAEEAQEHVDEQVIDKADAEVVAEQVIVDTQEDDRDQRAEDEIGESTTDRTELDIEVTRRQEGGEQRLPVATTAGVDGRLFELEEMPETVAVEREQEPTDHEEGVEEEGELTSLVQQPEAVEEAAGVARLFGGRGLGESVWHIPHSFSFSPQKRDRKLSDEEQTRSSRRRRSGPSRRWSSTAAEEALLRRRRFRVAREHKTYKIGDIATEHGPRDPCTQP